MPNKGYITLIDLIPDPPADLVKQRELVDEARNFLESRGRKVATLIEIAFVTQIIQSTHVLNKAKAMLADNKFTVEFIGDIKGPTTLYDFAIIPLKEKSAKNNEPDP